MLTQKKKVLIVDDEFLIGALVKKLIHWEDLNLECLDVLVDSEKALDLIVDKKPDLVITDIKMPRVSGLQLIEKTREKGIDSRFIVLSGYKEFEYAQKALAFGVDEYILKPVNEEELNAAVRKAKIFIQEKDNYLTTQEELKKTVYESKKILRRDFLSNIVDSRNTSECKVTPMHFIGECYRGIDIKLDYFNPDIFDTLQDTKTIEKVRNLTETVFRECVEDIIICEKEYLHIYLLLSYDAYNSAMLLDKISELLTLIKDYLMGFDQYDVTIGIGDEKVEFGDIRFSILESYRAICNRMLYGTGRLIYSEVSEEDDYFVSREQTENIRKEVKKIIESYSEERMRAFIQDTFDESDTEQKKNTIICYKVAESIIESFFDIADWEELKADREKMIMMCHHCNKYRYLKLLLERKLTEYISMLRKRAESNYTKPIRVAKQYIEDHYEGKIVLDDIARIVDLNPVYFSTLFKKETGMNFSAYLSEVRIEKAKEMLTSSNDTVAAIGAAVGYPDQKYFSQLFKKITGVKPAIYRKLHS